MSRDVPEKMRAAVYYRNNDIRVEERPKPRIGPGELLVRIIASGVCGSDVMEWYRIKKAPLVLGHEIAGEIVEVGDGVQKYKLGDRVFVSHHVPCNMCRWCLAGHHTACDTLLSTNFDPGGFCEFVRVPAINVEKGTYVLPDEISYDEGTFVEPLGCVARGQRTAQLKPGQGVLVIGSGISGVLHIALSRAMCAGKIVATDISDYRLDAAKRFGADVALRADEDIPAGFRKANWGRLADLVIVCTAAKSAIAQAFKCVDRGGTILFFAPTEPGVEIPFPFFEFWRNGTTVVPTYGAAPLDIITAIDLIASRRIPVKDMITHRLPLKDAALGFRLVAEAGESVKVIIEPGK
jgi:L-iditol 2-dehydrogenase